MSELEHATKETIQNEQKKKAGGEKRGKLNTR